MKFMCSYEGKNVENSNKFFLNCGFYAKLALWTIRVEDLGGQLYNESNYE